MAITLLQQPILISPVYNPMFYLTSSNYSSETGFKYSYDLYDSDGVVAGKKVLPFPNDYGRMDVSTLLRNFLTDNLRFDITGSTQTFNSIKVYDLFIGHTGSTHTLTPATSGRKYVFNGVFNQDESIRDYMLNNQLRKFLTNSPYTINVRLTDYYTLSCLNGYFGVQGGYHYYSHYYYILVSIYYSNGTSIERYILNPNYYFNPVGLVDVDKMYQTMGVGPMNLTNLYNYDTDEYETGQFIHSGVTHYSIRAFDLDYYSDLSKTYTFVIDKEIRKYEPQQVCFLNRLGNFSYFTFTGKSNQVTKANRDQYLQNRYKLVDDEYVTDSSFGGLTTYSVDVDSEYTFSSDFIDQPTFDFMEELFTSPSVYWLKNNKAYPIVITDTEWSNKKKINDKEIQFQIKVKLSNKKRINQ